MNPTPDEWIERMLIKVREGEATPDEVKQLRELLTTNAAARRVYVRAKQMDMLLETTPPQSVALAATAKVRGANVSVRWKIATLASAAAAVVALAFLLFGGQANDGRDRDAAVAVVQSSFEAVIDGREVLQGEQPMRAGTYKLERGSVQLRFGNGADVVIEGPAAFDLVDAATMHLNQGSLWAHCSEEARGFAVRMPGGRELVDFGTEFGARVDAEGGAQVKVMQGEVKIHDAVARSLELTTGKAANWELTAPPLAVDEADVQPFQSALALAAKVKAAPSIENWTVALFRAPQGGDGDWNLPENWESGELPGARKLERAVINESRVARVLPGLQPPLHPVDINVSNGPAPVPGPDGTLDIHGNLECQTLRIATANGAHGVVNQLGGTVNVTDSLIASSHTGNPTFSHYQLSGGTLNVGHVIWLGFKGAAEFTLHGSKAIVTADRMSLGPNAVLTFALDSDGVGLVKLRDTLRRHPDARLVIDGTQYRGGARIIPLMAFGSNLNDERRFTPQQVRFEGFAGVMPRLAARPGALDLVLEAVR